jgi:hypothetical protein
VKKQLLKYHNQQTIPSWEREGKQLLLSGPSQLSVCMTGRPAVVLPDTHISEEGM